jgi:hypothetical protein
MAIIFPTGVSDYSKPGVNQQRWRPELSRATRLHL